MTVSSNVKIRQLTLCGVMAAVLCVIAPVSVPIGPISLTGGTLAVYLTACWGPPGATWRAICP